MRREIDRAAHEPLLKNATDETIINSNTTNRSGLVVRARLDRRRYPTGRKVSAKELRALKIERDDFDGDWNCVIKPRKEMR